MDCYTSNAAGQAQANGLYATCDNVNLDADGSFFVDMQVAHEHGRTSNVIFTVIPVGVDEGGHGDNDSLALALPSPFTGRRRLPRRDRWACAAGNRV